MARTPLVEIEGVYAKLECVNPSGSIKDRIAEYILERSEELGLLRPGMRIVEATSGNTGIALARQGKLRGYPVTIVMPEHMTDERKELIRGFGAELVLCSREGSFAEAVEIRDEMARCRDVFTPDQFSNPLNVECHERTTGAEILRNLGHAPSAFVAGVGTGGTLIGVGQALKAVFPRMKVIAVEPSESAVMSGGEPGEHGIQGIGDGFIPPIAGDGNGGLHPIIDDVVRVSTEEATMLSIHLQEAHGLCVGVSSGANFLAAKRVSESFGHVVTILPDGYAKYVSHGLSPATDPPCPFKSICPGHHTA